jgi:hypothetical protein
MTVTGTTLDPRSPGEIPLPLQSSASPRSSRGTFDSSVSKGTSNGSQGSPEEAQAPELLLEQAPEVPEVLEVRAEDGIRAAARQGNFVCVSLVHGRSIAGEGITQFDPSSGWLQSMRQRISDAPAVLAVLDLADVNDLGHARNLMREMQCFHLNTPVFAVQLVAHQNIGVEYADEIRGLWNLNVAGVITQVMEDPQRYRQFLVDEVQVGLIRVAVDDRRREGQNENLQRQLDDAEARLDFLFWHWIPTQLRLDSIPRIDQNLDEEADGSIANLRFVRSLGRGAFGAVHEAQDDNGQVLAVKVMRKDNAQTVNEVERIYREIQILAQIPPHPHLAQLHNVLHSVDALYICLAYGGPHNLYHVQLQMPHQRWGLEKAQEIFVQIADAVGHLHRNVLFHRDIKPENIVVNGDQENGFTIMLVDCGLAVATVRSLKQPCGSLPFAAPEILDVPCQYYGGPADAFALGMVLFEIVRGLHVMESILGWQRGSEPSPVRAQQLRTVLANGPPTARRDTNEPAELTTICAELLKIDPARRWTVQAVLGSPWVNRDAVRNRLPPLVPN